MAAPEKAAKPTPKPEPRRPYHVGMSIGMCAGVYAGSLAVVSMLQIDHDQAVIRDRAPIGEAIELLGSQNEVMSSKIDVAVYGYRHASDRYDIVAQGVVGLQSAVERLSTRVQDIKGSAMKLPDAIALPPIPRDRVASSGGGNGSSGSSGSGSGSSTSNPKPKPAPPPTDGSTGASGGG
jgi:uncharacterized membrane protein YgcG